MIRRDLFKNPQNQLEQGAQAAPHAHEGERTAQEEAVLACPHCKRLLFEKDAARSLYVCECGHHFRLPARKRIALTVDEGSFCEHDGQLVSTDPLHFPGYPEKLAAAQKASGENEAVLTGSASMDGLPVAIYAMEPRFMMGSMGAAVGERLTRLFEWATQQRLPVIGFALSGGARMQEGIFSLMQMAKTSAAVRRHSDAGLLFVSVLTDPTTGGVTASFAMQGDILLSEPGALIGFAGPRVIEQTIRQTLPEGFQSAAFLLEHGFLDALCDRRELRALLCRLLRLHAQPLPCEKEA